MLVEMMYYSLSILILISLFLSAQCSKILLLPIDHQGHVNFFIISGKALSALGHDVHVLTMAKYRTMVEDAGLTSITHTPSPDALSLADDSTMGEQMKSLLQSGPNPIWSFQRRKLLKQFLRRMTKQCEEILQNHEIYRWIEDAKFDIAMVDSSFISHCLLAVVYKHGLRYVVLSDVWINPWEVRVPAMLSVEPLPMTPFTNEMSFFQRLLNIFAYFMVGLIKPMIIAEPDYLIETYIPNKPKITLAELHRKSELFFTNLEIFLMDYPRISSPHYIYVGSIGGSPPKPLETDLNKFVSSAKEGVILVSFGSMFQQMPEVLLKKLFSTFSHFPTRKIVIRSIMSSDLNEVIPDNVKVMKWLPQNDLLGHKNVKLFITHGGINGQMEALYHGVPMVVSPVLGDQHYNGAKVKHRKYGLVINMKEDSPETMVEVIKEVLDNPVYAQNIKKASKIYKALPKANETVAYWVDHVLRFGSDHLRPSYLDMPLYQLFMLDVLIFIVVFIIIVSCSVYLCCRCCCRWCAKYTRKSKTE